MILERQERLAILILLVVLLILGVASLFLNSSYETWAVPYDETHADKTLVSHSGIIESVTETKTGGHQILVISGVTVFLPNSDAEKIHLTTGDRVTLTGVMGTYNGQREIMVTDPYHLEVTDPGVRG
ncbi:MAG: hypothetical protein JXA44_13350 [Methanospirillaceae archaeon]|nr:hypothetical protein [Methanospirillaceae archaeon]